MLAIVRKPLVAAVGVLMMLALTVVPAAAQFDEQHDPGTEAFQRTWARTDKPVAEGRVERTWMWGPAAFTEVMMEEYADSPGGERQVQYFDKARMEINQPDGPQDALWYVTNGLLVVELVSGNMQVGDDEFVNREPADVQIAGDPDQMFGPTYADIQNLGLRSAPATPVGEVIDQELSGDNQVAANGDFADYGVTGAMRVQVPGIDHTVASVFWDFMNSTGLIYENGEFVQGQLFENPFYATGYPITEAYWSVVPVQGAEQDVLWQCFERRCLTYTPSNQPGFQVEAGNVGQHYYTWRYLQEPEEPPEEPEAQQYSVLFGSLNGSGVNAEGTLSLTGDQLTVQITASGLEADQVHAQHIHHPESQAAVCPTPELDTNEDGFISIDEGLPAYGGVVVPLFSNQDAEEFPTADADGNLTFEKTFTVDPELDLSTSVIVLHGMTANLEGDDAEEEGYIGSLPVACGQIYPTDEVPEAEEVSFDLNELNSSGVDGTADLSLVGQVLTVNISATGLEGEQLHPQHLHGVEGEVSTCPVPEEADTNEDGVVTVEEGAPFYGPVMVPFTPFPTVGEDGALEYSESYIVDPETIDLDTRAVVLHGMTTNIEGDDVEEDSYIASVPVACGDQAAQDTEADFSADLTPPEDVTSDASGTFTMDFNQDEASASYTITVADIQEVTAAHIHLQSTGEILVPLFSANEGEEPSFTESGELVSGTFTADDFQNAAEGMTMQELVDLINAGDTYVNVHTSAYPQGEIQGTITATS